MTIPVGTVYQGIYDASAGVLPRAPQGHSSFWSITVEGTLDGTQYDVGTNLVYDWAQSRFYKDSGVNPEWNLIQNKPVASTRWAKYSEVTDKPDNIVMSDSDGDIQVRMLRATYPTQSAIPKGSSIAFRINSSDDNFTRYADEEAIKEYLGTVRDSELLEGHTFDDVKDEARRNLVPVSLTINHKRLDGPIEITKADVGLGNVPNYKETNSPVGRSTTLLATQRAAYEASAAPRLAEERKRIIGITEGATDATVADGVYIETNKGAKTFTIKLKHEGLWYAMA